MQRKSTLGLGRIRNRVEIHQKKKRFDREKEISTKRRTDITRLARIEMMKKQAEQELPIDPSGGLPADES